MRYFLLAITLIFGFQLNAQLSLQWAYNFGHINADYAYFVKSDDQGNVYVAGTFVGPVDFDPDTGVLIPNQFGLVDLFVQKFDSLGNLMWVKTFGGPSGSDGLHDFQIDVSGNMYLSGSFYDRIALDPDTAVYTFTSTGQYDGFLLKLNSSGEFEWARVLEGSSNSYGAAVGIMDNGDIIWTGTFEDTVDLDPGSSVLHNVSQGVRDVFVLRLNEDGILEWAKTFGGTDQQYVNNIGIDPVDDIVILGTFQGTTDFDPDTAVFDLTGPAFNPTAYLLKLSSEGRYKWVETAGGGNVWPTGLITRFNGDIIISGTFGDTIEVGRSGPVPLHSKGASDSFVAEFASRGSVIWAKAFGDTASERIHDIQSDENLNIYVAGRFDGSPDMDPGPGITQLYSRGLEDFLIGKLGFGGVVEWFYSDGGTGYDLVYDLELDPAGNILIVGQMSDSCSLVTSTGSILLETNGSADILVAKYKVVNTIGKEEISPQEIKIYPNPVEEFLHISGLPAETSFTIQSVEGRGIMEGRVSQNERIDVSNLIPAPYIINFDSDVTGHHRFIKL